MGKAYAQVPCWHYISAKILKIFRKVVIWMNYICRSSLAKRSNKFGVLQRFSLLSIGTPCVSLVWKADSSKIR